MAGGPAGGEHLASTATAPPAHLQQIAAFVTEHVLTDPRITCVEAWDGALLAGCSDGTLLVVRRRPSNSGSSSSSEKGAEGGAATAAAEAVVAAATDGAAARTGDGSPQPPAPPRWVVVQMLRGFGQRRVLQLLAAPARSMLLCLADDGLNAHDLPTLRLKGQAARTRGAGVFAWEDEAGLLAVAVKRRLLLFKYDGLEFVPQREVTLPEPPHSLAAIGGTTVYAACKRDYLSIDAATGAITPLFPGAPASAPAAALATAIAVVSPTEVLLTRGSQSLFYGPEGRPSRQRGGGGGIRWSAPPSAVLAAAPFAVAVIDGGRVEARPLEPLSSTGLEQQLALPAPEPLDLMPPPSAPAAAAAALSAPSPRLFAGTRGASKAGTGAGGGGGSGGEVHVLVPMPAAQQAAQLLALGEHEEALAMCGLVPVAAAEVRRALEDRVHLAYGRRLFRLGQYEAAMMHLGMSGLAGPVQLLRLFPSLAPAHLLRAAAEAEQAARGPCAPAAEEDEAAEEGAEGAVAGPAPGTEGFQQAVATLMPYLLSHRSRLAAAAAGGSPSPAPGGGTAATAAAAAGATAAAGGGGAAPAAMERSPSARAAAAADAAAEAVRQRLSSCPLAVLVDTALLQALLALPDSGALLRFVARPNCVDTAVGEAALRGAGRYSELVALHQSRGQHAAALGLLRTLSQAPGELPTPPRGAAAELHGLPGVWAAVRYLCQLHPPPADLLATHARWILASDPEAGLEMFASLRPPVPPSVAMPMLTSYAPALAAPYLEAALAAGAADPALHEQELAMLYLQRVLGEPGSTPARLSLPEYGKLKQLILRSGHLDHGALLRLLPAGRLLELRAALLERLGQHAEALRILVHRLGRPAWAEAYADRVYARRQARRRARRQAAQQQAAQQPAAAAAVGGGSVGGGAGAGGVGAARSLQFGGGEAPPHGSVAGVGRQAGSASAGTAAAVAAAAAALSSSSSSPLRAPRPGAVDADADIYLLLVQVLLEEEDGRGGYRLAQRAPTHEVWGDVARLLSRKRDAIEPLHALGLLPGEAPLSTAQPFLEGGLLGAAERRRGAVLGRGLRRSEQVRLLAALAAERRRSILLTPERACALCYKRIGSSAFAALPTGQLAHYSCFRREVGPAGMAAAVVHMGSGSGGSSTTTF